MPGERRSRAGHLVKPLGKGKGEELGVYSRRLYLLIEEISVLLMNNAIRLVRWGPLPYLHSAAANVSHVHEGTGVRELV